MVEDELDDEGGSIRNSRSSMRKSKSLKSQPTRKLKDRTRTRVNKTLAKSGTLMGLVRLKQDKSFVLHPVSFTFSQDYDTMENIKIVEDLKMA